MVVNDGMMDNGVVGVEIATECSELVAIPVFIVLLLIDRMPFHVFLTFEAVVDTPPSRNSKVV